MNLKKMSYQILKNSGEVSEVSEVVSGEVVRVVSGEVVSGEVVRVDIS
jgi:hypothetical protein